jgi:hypothetical protein
MRIDQIRNKIKSSLTEGWFLPRFEWIRHILVAAVVSMAITCKIVRDSFMSK